MNVNHFDLNTLRLFVTAADCKSLTKAAEISSITLSAVSKRISELERNLECQLFTRQPLGLELTSAGLGLLRHARALLDSVNSMASELNDYAKGAVSAPVLVAGNIPTNSFLNADSRLVVDLHILLSGISTDVAS